MLRDHFQPVIEQSLTPKAVKELETAMINYVDRNSDLLMGLDLSRRFSFGDGDRDVVYRAIGLTPEIITEALKASKDINKSNKNHNNPFYSACLLCMRQLLVLKKEKEAKMLMTYMSLMMYTSIHKGLFKYNPNKQIMDYTLANLDNSYKIRSMSSLYAFLDDNAQTCFQTYKARIQKLDDRDITYVIDALHNRVKGKLRKIANAFYKNYESGNYLNADTDSFVEGDYHEMDNNSFAIDRLANKIFIRLLNHQFDDRFIKYAITRSDVSYQKLKNLIDDIIQDDENNVVRKYISANIEHYLLNSGKSYDYIARGDFITYMKAAYASNTDSPQMAFIKQTMDGWLDEHMLSMGRQNYGKTARLVYKKAMYMFFIFVINYEAKT